MTKGIVLISAFALLAAGVGMHAKHCPLKSIKEKMAQNSASTNKDVKTAVALNR